MARKNPLGKLVDTAVDALKDPVGTAGKVVGQARGTASLGKLAAEQVTKAAASTALGAAGAVAERAGVRKPSARSSEPGPEPRSPADLRPVPPVNEPAHPPVDEGAGAARAASTTARKAPAKKADGSSPAGGTSAAKKAPAKKAPAKKAPAKKAAKATAARVRPAAPEPTAVPDRRAAEPASGRQEQALSPNPEEVAKKAAAKGAAANEAPAKRAAASKTVKQAPAKKSAAKKSPAKKAPAKKSAAKVAESRDVAPVAEDETVWSTSTPGDKLPAGRRKRNEADPEVPVTKDDLEAAREASPADVAERVEGD